MTVSDKDWDVFTNEAKKEEIDSKKKVKVGIVGCGWIAGSHLKAYLKMEDVEIVAAADIIPGKAEKFFAKYGVEGVRCYLSHKDMIDNEDLDAVSICTYNCQHAEPAIYALEHGVNVMLEKPFTVTLDEAVAVMKAEKKSGKILTIGFQPRMSENMQMIKKIVQSGELGDIYYLQAGGGRRRGIPTPYGTSFIEKETGGIGAVGDIGSYSIDMLLNAVGYPKPLTVSGYTSNFFGTDPNYYAKSNHPEYAEKFGVDDFAAAFVRLEGGIVLDFRISWAMHMDTCGDALILGTKGGLRIPSTECWNGEFKTPLKVYRNIGGEPMCYEVPMIETKFDLFEQKLRSFVNEVKKPDGEGKATVSSAEILYNQAIIDGIVKSAELGKEIEIQIPEI
ncbi:MAG: Gfo/Idh/MocA family oxidoreductase [Clostridia bacterium]|nr:Gfo/Idh/MocA family oxidoreductase [Clostridia bacterium]